MSFEYIASPYSGSKDEMQLRFEKVEEITAKMLIAGKAVYSPIVHCHEMAIKHKLPTAFEFWQNYNRAMLASASKLIVIRLPGWNTSIGVTAEMEFAKLCGIPISYVYPNTY